MSRTVPHSKSKSNRKSKSNNSESKASRTRTRASNSTVPSIFTSSASDAAAEAKLAAFRVPGAPDILVQALVPTSQFLRQSKPGGRVVGLHVVSSCLFIFPGRAKGDPVAYSDRVVSYLEGLEMSLVNMRHYPGWIYRLYIDSSVYFSAPDGDEGRGAVAQNAQNAQIAKIARYVQRRVQQLQREHSTVLQTMACRYLREGYRDGETFMPSIWRYLPMTDPDVYMFCVCDLDNPLSPLLMHFANAWDDRGRRSATRDARSNLLFVMLDSYNPPQCALYAMSHLDTIDHGMCPVAQFWFWRRIDGYDTESLFRRMLDLSYSPELRAFFQDLDLEWLQRSVGPRLVSSDAYTRALDPGAYPSSHELANALSDALVPALHDTLSHASQRASMSILRPSLSGRDRGSNSDSNSNSNSGSDSDSGEQQCRRRRRWASLVVANAQMRQLAALLLCGKLMASEFEDTQLSSLIGNNVDDKAVRAFSDIAVKSGYGVDEWLLHVLLRPHAGEGRAELLRSSSPDLGIESHIHLSLHKTNPTPHVVHWLQGFVKLLSADAMAWGRSLYAEFLVRCCLLLRLLQPDPAANAGARPPRDVASKYAKMRTDYLQRLVHMLGHGDSMPPALAQRIRDRIELDLLCNDGYMKAVAHRLLNLRRDLFQPWLARHGVTFDPRRYRFAFTNSDGFLRVKDVLLCACLLEMRMLHIAKYFSTGDLPW